MNSGHMSTDNGEGLTKRVGVDSAWESNEGKGRTTITEQQKKCVSSHSLIKYSHCYLFMYEQVVG